MRRWAASTATLIAAGMLSGVTYGRGALAGPPSAWQLSPPAGHGARAHEAQRQVGVVVGDLLRRDVAGVLVPAGYVDAERQQ